MSHEQFHFFALFCPCIVRISPHNSLRLLFIMRVDFNPIHQYSKTS